MFGIVLFISGQEIVFAVLIALLLFGSKEIPKLARTFGKGMKEFRKATDDIKREFESSTPEVMEDFKEIKKNISKDVNVINAKTGSFKSLFRSVNRSDAHDFRRTTGNGCGQDFCSDVQVVGFCKFFGTNQNSRSSIRDW